MFEVKVFLSVFNVSGIRIADLSVCLAVAASFSAKILIYLLRPSPETLSLAIEQPSPPVDEFPMLCLMQNYEMFSRPFDVC
jgi:hypothetical protein